MEKKIINLFLFTNGQRQMFKGAGEYSELMEAWLHKNEIDDSQFYRMMLISFYLEYELCCEQGVEFETTIEDRDYPSTTSKLWKQFQIFNSINRKSITSTEEYEELVNNKSLGDFSGRAFFEYVIGIEG